jgi:hypothetical protein
MNSVTPLPVFSVTHTLPDESIAMSSGLEIVLEVNPVASGEIAVPELVNSVRAPDPPESTIQTFPALSDAIPIGLPTLLSPPPVYPVDGESALPPLALNAASRLLVLSDTQPLPDGSVAMPNKLLVLLMPPPLYPLEGESAVPLELNWLSEELLFVARPETHTDPEFPPATACGLFSPPPENGEPASGLPLVATNATTVSVPGNEFATQMVPDTNAIPNGFLMVFPGS